MARRGNSTVAPRSGDSGGGRGRYTIEGVGGVVEAGGNLPQVSAVVIGSSWRVRPSVTVRHECRHDALGFPPPTRRVLTMARLPRLYGAVAGGGIHLGSSVPSASLAGSRDCFQEPFSSMPGAVYLLYIMA